MHRTGIFRTLALEPDGGIVLGLHWIWWALWLVIGAALIWGLARGLRGSG